MKLFQMFITFFTFALFALALSAVEQPAPPAFDPTSVYKRAEIEGFTVLTNKKEYFSELTEAYFGRNDFYPFSRSDLKEYDPVGYQMMVDCWGLPEE